MGAVKESCSLCHAATPEEEIAQLCKLHKAGKALLQDGIDNYKVLSISLWTGISRYLKRKNILKYFLQMTLELRHGFIISSSLIETAFIMQPLT